ncbi:hypothetical protein [Halioglobus japonicus]|uniref:hypothetical protein n=1 Tax=Halioglobus japonicus TaxID=930805 RepID=UPI0011AF161E|nr:hypothetical protein [Halioglobus japonicus]
METGQRGESRSEHNTLLIRRHEGKMYLGLGKGALIEASDNGKQLAYSDEPNMLGTRSLSYTPSSGAIRYEAAATRYNKAIGKQTFEGTCSPSQKSRS